jgi:UvrD-like helicase C-terminal domain
VQRPQTAWLPAYGPLVPRKGLLAVRRDSVRSTAVPRGQAFPGDLVPSSMDPTEQQQAVINDDWTRHARVLAGPGTGKGATAVALAERLSGVTPSKIQRKFIPEMAAMWESLVPEEDPDITPAERAKFSGAFQEHRWTYGYTLLAELPDLLRRALEEHEDLRGLDYDALVIDEYQEERRLLYVAMTRSTERLYLTYARRRYGPQQHANQGSTGLRNPTVLLQNSGVTPQDGRGYLERLGA